MNKCLQQALQGMRKKDLIELVINSKYNQTLIKDGYYTLDTLRLHYKKKLVSTIKEEIELFYNQGSLKINNKNKNICQT